MIQFLKNIFSKDITFFCTEPGIKDIAPILRASELTPDWWRKIDYNHNVTKDDNNLPLSHGTVKKCPGIIEFLRTGFIVPMWTDLHIHIKDGNVNCQSSNFNNFCSLNDDRQFIEHIPLELRKKTLKVLKLHSPWAVKCKRGVRMLYLDPFFHFNEYFQIVPGIKHHNVISNNFFLLLKKEGSFVIERGTPLCILFPYKNRNFTFTSKYLSLLQSEELKIAASNIMSSKFSSAEAFKNLISSKKCPFHDMLK